MNLKSIPNIVKDWFIEYDKWTQSWENDKNYIKTLQEYNSDPLSSSKIAIRIVKPNSKVLSAGCGAGREVKFLVRELNCKVTALDISKNMIEMSKKIEPKAKYIQGDMASFLSEEKFDHIVCLWNTINFIPNLTLRKKFIHTCYNNLRGGEI